MVVLHAQWEPPHGPNGAGRVLFWAESARGSRGGRRRRKVPGELPHPFASSTTELGALLASLGFEAGTLQRSEIALWLPSDRAGPRPSPHLLHDWDIDATAETVLRRWKIPALRATAPDAVVILNGLPAAELLPSSVRAGADFLYWRRAVTLLLEAFAAQKLLPTLATAPSRQTKLHARWVPVLDSDQDGPRLSALREGMPPVCRSGAADPAGAPTPRQLLDSFLHHFTDDLARHWGGSARPAPAYRARDTAGSWIAALLGQEPSLSGSAVQLQEIVRAHRHWLRNLHPAGDEHFRVAFRLQAPGQQDTSGVERSTWTLAYLLQARDDPSLLVPAEAVWNSRGNALEHLNRRFDQPQEKLLAGMGFAARLFPPLREGLRQSRPTEQPLDSHQAYQFLRESAPLLESSGFGLLVPPWWNKPGSRLGVRLQLQPGSQKGETNVSTGHVSFKRLVQYRWELSVGGATLTREEFEALVRLKSPLVQIRGQWVQLDPDHLEAAIRFWESQELSAELTLPEALRMARAAEAGADGLPVEGVEGEGWIGDFLARLNGDDRLAVLPQPDSLKGQLRPYQAYGYSWLHFLQQWGLGALLADDMGLGKSIQTLSMLLRVREEMGALPAPVLLVAPTSVVFNWTRELQQFAPDLRYLVHHGPNRHRDEAFLKAASEVEIVLTSYALARLDAATLARLSWLGIILDEAQNIKNPAAKQTRLIRTLPAEFRVALTGTPVENRLSELWSIMHFLNPGFMGSQKQFRKRFVLPIERYGNDEARTELKEMVSPFMLRRVKTDPTVISDLPDKLETRVYCTLSQEQATLYEAVVQDALARVEEAEGIDRRGLILAMLLKLKQICDHPSVFLHQVGSGEGLTTRDGGRSGKLERLAEMLEEVVAGGERALIFTQFTEMGTLLKSFLQEQLGVGAQFLHGGTPAKQRERMVTRFQEEPDGPPLFIISLKAGGTGLNLTRANHVFHFDRWWNPAVEDQATDRAFRIGQKRNVQVHKFVCVGTMEEMIDEMIESKKALAQSVVGKGENWLTELSTAELRELVRLRSEAT